MKSGVQSIDVFDCTPMVVRLMYFIGFNFTFYIHELEALFNVLLSCWCYRYTSLVECYIPNITTMLRDDCYLVRRQTLTVLTKLLQVKSGKQKPEPGYIYVTHSLTYGLDKIQSIWALRSHKNRNNFIFNGDNFSENFTDVILFNQMWLKIKW